MLSNRRKPTGLSAMLRVRNEEEFIRKCIESIADVFDEIVVIDNGSTDATYDILQEMSERAEFFDSLKLHQYPFSIARCGPDHAATNEFSLSSLAYYYNWCLSKCKYSLVVKWDADMYCPDVTRAQLHDTLSLIARKQVFVLLPIQTMYLDEQGKAYGARNEINAEVRAFPNVPYVRFRKAEHWEQIMSDCDIPSITLDNMTIYEMKDVRQNEFDHWSTNNFPTERKKREWENFNKVKRGRLDENFVRLPEMDFAKL